MADDTNADTATLGARAQQAADAMKQSADQFIESGAELRMKLIAQAEENMHQAFAAMRAAASARDMSALLRVQGEYLREQGTRSIEQAREIGVMMADYGREAMTRVTNRG